MNIVQIAPNKKEDFFNDDLLDFTTYPDEEIATFFSHRFLHYRKMNFKEIKSESLRQEVKEIFKSCLEAGKPYTIKSIYFKYLFHLPTLANKVDADSFLDVDETDLANFFDEIIKDKNLAAESSRIIPAFIFTLYEIKDTRTGTDRDIWYLKDFKLDETRLNKSKSETVLNFRRIENPEHRDYIKKWFKYLLGCTEYALSTILNYLPQITMFSNQYSYKSLFEITEYDVTHYLDSLTTSINSRNKFANSLGNFYKYMAIKGYLTTASPVKKYHLKKEKYVPADNLVSENVILQIIGKLHLLDHSLECMYLINYTTGMRISDICQLTIDCLYEDGDDGYYIRVFDCQKMQKPIMNEICHALYELLQIQIKTIISLEYEEKYLFPAPKKQNTPYQSNTYRKQMKLWCKEMKIKNDDGTDYDYTTHSYRHTLATDLFQNYNVDLQIIQLAVLWHKEIQMSLTYAQRGTEFNKAQHAKYIASTGEQSSMNKDIIADADALHKKALGNGYCNYPSRLGTCPNADVCLDCQFFRTSTQFIEVHKKQLEEVNKNIILYRSNGWENNLATALDTQQKLLTIIESLENLT